MPEGFCACTGDCEGPRGCPTVGIKPYYFAEDDCWWRDVMWCPTCGGRFLNWGNATHLCRDNTLWRVQPGIYQTTLVAQTPWMDWETMGMAVR